jgi:hypothetical protein
MKLAKHEHSTTEMERNRIVFYKRFKRIRERKKRTCQLIGETSAKHNRGTL